MATSDTLSENDRNTACRVRPDDLWHRIGRALFDSDLIATRLTLAVAEMAWAIMLIWPGQTFLRPAYLYQSKVMTEEAWALVFLLSSVTQASIVLLKDQHSRFARYFAAWNAGLWVFTVSSVLLSVYPPPAAIGGEVALAISAVWVFIRPYLLSGMYAKAERVTCLRQ